MPSLTLLTCLRFCLFSLLAGAGGASLAQSPGAPPAPEPIAHFFDNPVFSGARLSPNGRFVAVRVAPKSGRVRLAAVDLATMKSTVLAEFKDADVGQFRWVNDKRLVLTVTDNELAVGDVRAGPGLYAVNVDGGGFLQLVSRQNQGVQINPALAQLLPPNTRLLQAVGQQTGDDVYVTQTKLTELGTVDYVSLLRLNTVTGQAKPVPRPNATMHWLMDQNGAPRIAEAQEQNRTIIYYKDNADSAWRQLAAFDSYRGAPGAFSPVAFAPDGTLFVQARNGDKSALYTYDPDSKQRSPQPIVTLDGHDFDGQLIMSRDDVLGVAYEEERARTRWFDAKMAAIQAAIDQALPDAVNTIRAPLRPELPYLLISSGSDRQPPTYLLFNTTTNELSPLGAAYPAISLSRMSPKRLVRYAARDGLPIPAWLTLPQGRDGQNLPMVVLVHGGPWVRGDSWDWDPEVQFLASRGYAVLQPAFRGSTGLGQRHFKAGWKQWGLAMQDDLADGARWAIAEGIANPNRICIAGASYGGYATLMGLVNDADLFRCGVAWLGVTDLTLMQKGHWSSDSDLSDIFRDYGMPLLVGDAERDAVQFNATSPLQQAARITQPLLLAYGGADRRVPLIHGNRLYDTVKRTNPNVEWVVYDEEGHGWALPKNRIDFWTRVEKFLNRNIGQGRTITQ
jgi:dipeptidyl aminopeptidase/acylaminoacyl peptidase